jgi:hypothetical protein
MEPSLWYEIVGYAASVLIAISLMMRSILKLRVINLIGSLFFTVYGLLIQAYPVAAVNFFIVLIDLYYLYQMVSAKEFFRLLEIRPDSEYLGYFLNFYEKDIRRFLPGYHFVPGADKLILFILRNVVPAGLVIGEKRGGDRLHVQLDYAIPGYRDLKIGRFVFQENARALRERGIREIYSEPGAPAHARYLERMGFTPDTSPEGEHLYCLKLE